MAEVNKRVLVLNHFAVPRGQPGGTRHVELFSRLDGWTYLIIAGHLNHLTGEPQPAAPGFFPVRVTPYRGNGLSRILNWVSYAFSAYVQAFRVGRVDVVYASSPHLLAAWCGWLVATARRVPFVLEVRDLWPGVLLAMGQLSAKSPVFRILTALETFLYNRATRIVVLAEGSRVEIASRGIDAGKIVYIPNGADPDDFRPTACRELLRERYGFERLTALYAGAHGPANGLDLVLDAAEVMDDPGLDIVLVGGGVQKAALIASAARRGLTNVRFLDPVPKEDVPDLLCAADVGLHVLADVDLFRTAVSPNKLFDYMAAGLPVITNCPGLVSELVTEAGCGYTVDPLDLRVAFEQCASDAATRRDLHAKGLAGQRWIAEHQSREAMASRLQRVLDPLAHKPQHK